MNEMLLPADDARERDDYDGSGMEWAGSETGPGVGLTLAGPFTELGVPTRAVITSYIFRVQIHTKNILRKYLYRY